MRVLALTPYPVGAASARFRLYGLVEPLARRGIHMVVRPLLDGATFATMYQRAAWPRTTAGLAKGLVGRIGDIARAHRADVVVVQRDAALLGPPVIEWLCTAAQRTPLVLDIDDATYIRHAHGTYGAVARLVRWPSKPTTLLRWASVATCGNPTVAAHARALGTAAVVVPTVVPVDEFCPGGPDDGRRPCVVGWIGTHTTFPYLEALFPALQRLAVRHSFTLKIVGSGRAGVAVPGVDVRAVDWSLERETEDFRSIDIGLYPLSDDAWAQGKSGLKAIEYMAVGIPFVASPVGAATEVGIEGTTHLCARGTDGWVAALGTLIENEPLRRKMGAAGRAHVLSTYTPDHASAAMADALRLATAIGPRQHWGGSRRASTSEDR